MKFHPKRSGRVSVKSFTKNDEIQGYILKLPQVTCDKSQYKTLSMKKKNHCHSTTETLHDTKVETLGWLISSTFIPKFVTSTLFKIAHSGHTAATITPPNLSLNVKASLKGWQCLFKVYNKVGECGMCGKGARGWAVNNIRNKRASFQCLMQCPTKMLWPKRVQCEELESVSLHQSLLFPDSLLRLLLSTAINDMFSEFVRRRPALHGSWSQAHMATAIRTWTLFSRVDTCTSSSFQRSFLVGHVLIHHPGKKCGNSPRHHSLSAAADRLTRWTDNSEYLHKCFTCLSKLSVGFTVNSLYI